MGVMIVLSALMIGYGLYVISVGFGFLPPSKREPLRRNRNYQKLLGLIFVCVGTFLLLYTAA